MTTPIQNTSITSDYITSVVSSEPSTDRDGADIADARGPSPAPASDDRFLPLSKSAPPKSAVEPSAASIRRRASLSTSDAGIEMQTLGAPAIPRASLGLEELQVILRNLDDVSEASKPTLLQARRKLGRIKAALNANGCPEGLSDMHIARLEEGQDGIALMQSQETALNQMRKPLRKWIASGEADAAKHRTWKEWLSSAKVQLTGAALENILGMGGKFSAWSAELAILPGKIEDFRTSGAIAKLDAERTADALGFATMVEYPLTTDGTARWVAAGGDVKTITGLTQTADMIITVAGQFATNAASGQAAPRPGELGAFAAIALAGVLQSGAANKPILAALDYLRGGKDRSADAIEVDTAELRRVAQRQRAQEEHAPGEATGRDLEQGVGPAMKAPRGKKDVGALIDELWADVPKMKAHVSRALDSIAGIEVLISPPTQETEEAAVMGTLQEPAGPPPAQSALGQDPEAQIVQFKQQLQSILDAALETRDSLPADHELRSKIDSVFQDAKKAEAAVTEASKSLTPHDTAFLWGMAAFGAGGMLATFLGPITGNEWLSNLNIRSAISGLTSSFGQNLSNLGQFMGGAKPGDGYLMRFLKIGLDNEADNQVIKFAKNWARNTRFLPLEFIPLMISMTLAQMGSLFKGQIPDAPLHAVPSNTTIRIMMEAERLVLALAFTVFMLGHKLDWNHYAAVVCAFCGVAIALSTE